MKLTLRGHGGYTFYYASEESMRPRWCVLPELIYTNQGDVSSQGSYIPFLTHSVPPTLYLAQVCFQCLCQPLSATQTSKCKWQHAHPYTWEAAKTQLFTDEYYGAQTCKLSICMYPRPLKYKVEPEVERKGSWPSGARVSSLSTTLF